MSLLVSFLLLQAAAAAPTTAQPSEAPPDDLKIVCKILTATGSRLGGKRVCLSKKEWRRMHEEGQKSTRYYQDNASKMPPPGQ